MPATAEMTVGEMDVGLGGFQHVGRDAPPLGDDLVRGTPDRRPAHVGRARAAVPAAGGDQVGVALAQADADVRYAQACGEDLRECRFVALADRLRAGDQCHGVGVFETNIDVFMRRTTGGLDVIGEAQATQFAARGAVLAARRETRCVGLHQCAIESSGEVAAVHAGA